MSRILKTLAFAAVLTLGAGSAQAVPTCPAIGSSSGCAVVITRNADGSFSTSLTGVGPYDGNDDTLVGIINNGPGALTSITLSSSTDIFGFDGDGLARYPGGSTFGPTGYEGPNTSFTVTDAFHGTVNFLNGGIPVGGSAYFALEEDLSGTVGSPGTGVTVGGGTVAGVPEPATWAMMIVGMGLTGGVLRRTRRLGVRNRPPTAALA